MSDRYFTDQRNGQHYVLDRTTGKVISDLCGLSREAAIAECSLWNRAESALLAEVAAWHDKVAERFEMLAGNEAFSHNDQRYFGAKAEAHREAAKMLRDGAWRSHPSRGAGEAGR